MRARAFVLKPLSELLPGWVTPQDLQSVQSQAIEKLDAFRSDVL
jgi:7,8-dihydro-6-hydroxymethylpterin-pyrophosphokinase